MVCVRFLGMNADYEFQFDVGECNDDKDPI
jgi:hypothetical protein